MRRFRKIGVFALVIVLLTVLTIGVFSVFTDRVNNTITFTTATFTGDGYALARVAPEGYYVAGETISATIKESNTSGKLMDAVIHMSASWSSPDTKTKPWGNSTSSANGVLKCDGVTLPYTVRANGTISFSLPLKTLSVGAKDVTRNLQFVIPSSLKSTGTLSFSFDGVDVSRSNTNWKHTFSKAEINQKEDLSYAVGVIWNISKNQSTKDVVAYLTAGASADQYGLKIVKNGQDANTNKGVMKDWTAKNQTPWANYTIVSLDLGNKVTTIGDYAFAGETGITSVSIPNTITAIGTSAFDGAGLTGSVTVPASVKTLEGLAFGNLTKVNKFIFKHTSNTLSLPDNTSSGKTKEGAFYVPSYVATTIETSVKQIQYDYLWHNDNRKHIPMLDANNYWQLKNYDVANDIYEYDIDYDVLETITFVNYYIPDGTEFSSWDASDKSVPGSVTAYLSKDKKTLTVAGNGYGLVFANPDSSYAFYELESVKNINYTDILDTRKVTNMSWMFSACLGLESLNIRSWNVENVTHMTGMFADCGFLKSIDLSANNAIAKDRTGTYEAWNPKNLVEASAMFMMHGTLDRNIESINVTGWNTGKLQKIDGMFTDCHALTELKGISAWNTENVTTAENLFYRATSLESLDVSNWKTGKLQNAYRMFQQCESLKSINISNWDLSAVTDTERMFSDCESLTELTLPKTLSLIGSQFAYNCPKLTTITFLQPASMDISFPYAGYDGAFYLYSPYTQSTPLGTKVITSNEKVLSYDWTRDCRGYTINIQAVTGGTLTATPAVAINGKTITLTPAAESGYAYQGATVQYSENGTSKTVELPAGTKSLVMPALDDKTDGADMVITPKWKSTEAPILAAQDTWFTQGSPVTPGGETIYKSQISSIKLVDTYDVTGKTIVDQWDASTKWDGTATDPSGPVTAYVEDDGLGNGTYKLTLAGNGYGFVYGNEDSSVAFNYFTKATSVILGDVFNTTKIKNTSWMFNGMYEASTIDPGDYSQAPLEFIDGMFRWCYKVTSLDVTNWNVDNVTDFEMTFLYCYELKTLTGLETWDMNGALDLSSMFSGCWALPSLSDVYNWDVSTVQDFGGMFSGVRVTSIDLSNWDTSSGTYFGGMFERCMNLETLNVSSFDTSKIDDRYDLSKFAHTTPKLTKIILGPKFAADSALHPPTVENVTNSYRMFYTGDTSKYGYSKTNTLRTEVTGANAAMLGYDWHGDYRGYLVSAEAVTGGTVTATPSAAINGQTVTLTVETGTGYKYKGASVKYSVNNVSKTVELNADTRSFVMPVVDAKTNTADVIITPKWEKVAKPVLAENNTWYTQGGSSIATSKISSVTVKDIYTPSSYTAKWDASDGESGTVHAYLEDDGLGNGTYKLTLAGNGYGSVFANKSSRSAFGNYSAATTMDLGLLDTSEVMSAGWMLSGNSSITKYVGLDKWDTSNMEYMEWMLGGNSILTDFSFVNGWDVSSCYDFGSMFYRCMAMTTIDLSNWKIYDGDFRHHAPEYPNDATQMCNGIPMDNMFSWCQSVEYVGDLTKWNTKNVITTYSMFNRCQSLISLAGKGTTSTDLSSWADKVANLTTMEQMFEYCYKLGDISMVNWNLSALESTANMFFYSNSVKNINTSGWKTPVLHTASSMFSFCSALENVNISGWTNGITVTWSETVPTGLDLTTMFYRSEKLTNVTLTNFNTANVSSMYAMFGGCSALKNIDVTGFNTANTLDFRMMFQDCTSLQSLNLSTWDTKTAYTGGYLDKFAYNCTSLTKITLGPTFGYSGKIPAAGAEKGMFYVPSYLATTVEGANSTMSNYAWVTDNRAASSSTGGLVPVLAEKDSWFTAGGGTKSSITKVTFTDDYTGTYDSTWDASDPNFAGSVTAYLKGTEVILEGKAGLDYIMANKNSSRMFYGFTSLTAIEGIEMVDTSWSTTLSNAFYNCKVLTSLNIGGWNLSQVKNLDSAFKYCYKLQSLDVSQWDVSAVTTMKSMFDGCYVLGNLNVSQWDVSQVTTMEYMFRSCRTMTVLNADNWNVDKVENMHSMFISCYDLETIGVSNWSVKAAEDMDSMFYQCQSLKTLNVGNWQTGNVETMQEMFYSCNALETLNVNNWDVRTVETMFQMFMDCTSLRSIDLSRWSVDSLTAMSDMFNNCQQLTSLNFTNWDSTNVNDSTGTFAKCYRLKEVTLGSKFAMKNAVLPTPSSSYISGATGYWYDSAGKAFAPADIPDNVAATYYAVRP